MKELLVRVMEDDFKRFTATTIASLIISVFVCMSKLLLGAFLLSGWLLINALYYLVLCVAKGFALKQIRTVEALPDAYSKFKAENTTYRRGGMMLSLLGISYLLICLRMYFIRDAVVYSGNMIFLIATVAFTKLGVAIHGLLEKRNPQSPLTSTLRVIGLADAMVSIVVTQFALLSMEAVPHAMKTSALLGMVCSLSIILLGIVMLTKKKKILLQGDDLKSVNSPVSINAE